MKDCRSVLGAWWMEGMDGWQDGWMNGLDGCMILTPCVSRYCIMLLNVCVYQNGYDNFHSLFLSNICTRRRWKHPAGWCHWPIKILFSHPQLPTWPAAIQLAFLSLGAQLHYGDELCYCEDAAARSCRRGWSLAGHWGIMQWPGFRGQFTHCLKSISRNASLDRCPLRVSKGPLTTSRISALKIIVWHLMTA